MAGNVFLFGSVLSPERMSWIENAIKKYYEEKPAGGATSHEPGSPGSFSFFLTGDAVYSLTEAETQTAWSSLISLPDVHVTADSDATVIRGILKTLMEERYPDSVIEPGRSETPTFWSSVLNQTSGAHPGKPTIGWIQLFSPYSSPAASEGIACLSTALEHNLNVSVFLFLDGCHAVHTGQVPETGINIGESLGMIAGRSAEKGLSCTILTDRYSSNTRGYLSWDNGSGTMGSSCTIRPARIRDIDVMIRQMRTVPVLLSENSGYIPFSSALGPGQNPVVILITHTPYSSEFVYDGISLAVACANQGILTRIIFLEDGVYAVSGEHQAPEGSPAGTIPGLISHLPKISTMQFFVLIPSLALRGISKNGKLTMVTEIDYEGLAGILFRPEQNDSDSIAQRILFF